MSCVNRAFSLTGKILTKGLVALKRHFSLLCARRAFCCYVVLFLWSVLMSFPDFCWLWLFIFWLHFPWFILYRENVLGGTECACWCVLFRKKTFYAARKTVLREKGEEFCVFGGILDILAPYDDFTTRNVNMITLWVFSVPPWFRYLIFTPTMPRAN